MTNATDMTLREGRKLEVAEGYVLQRTLHGVENTQKVRTLLPPLQGTYGVES